MNPLHKALLTELKKGVDEEFGQSVIVIDEDGSEYPAFGIFSKIEKNIGIKGQSKRVGQLSVDSISATFSILPDSAVIKEGYTLIVDNQRYLVLPFKPRDFEVIIPLKTTETKDHNWR